MVSLNVFPPDPGENLDGSKTSFVVKPHRNLINAQSMGVENGTGGIRLSHSPAAGPASVPAGLLGTGKSLDFVIAHPFVEHRWMIWGEIQGSVQ